MSSGKRCLACNMSSGVVKSKLKRYDFECSICGYRWTKKQAIKEERKRDFFFDTSSLEFNLAGQLVSCDDD